MNQNKIPVRYARALFLLGKEKGILEKLVDDVKVLSDFFEGTGGLMAWLRSPVIKTSQKQKAFKQQFEGKLTGSTLRFIDFVLDKNRERYFPDIFRNFIRFYKEDAGIKTYILTTAFEIDDVVSQKVSMLFQKEGFKGHEWITRVKPSIIGGFMLQSDDQLYDASVATELGRLRKELTGQVLQETIQKSGPK